MACYHFRIKTDKKPDGTAVSAATHAEYIDRQGKYKDIDEARLERYGLNIISGQRVSEEYYSGNDSTLLYKSPFGNIVLKQDGLHISEGASDLTIAIAMKTAEQIFAGDLNIAASNTVKAKIVIASVNDNIQVSFADKSMNDAFNRLKEVVNNGRRFAERNRSAGNEEISQPDPECFAGEVLAKRKIGLPKLSASKMDLLQKESGMFLSDDEAADLIQRGRTASGILRWPVYGERVNKIADEIVSNIKTQAAGTAAAAHAQYINREEAFKKRGGCVKTGHHLPAWAEDNPKKFFEAADKFERANGTRYKEIEFSLPNELTLEQQQEIIDRFLETHLKDYYYAYAVHDKIGAMSNGQRHPHVHIMFSERKIDEIEKNTPRKLEVFFSRANNNSPEKGGCRKDEKWNGKNRFDYVNQMREDYARIQNEVLEKYGIEARVDHRTLKAQREEALANGNEYLAELLDRLPEPALKYNEIVYENNPKVVNLLEFRQQRKLREESITSKEFAKKSLEETNIRLQEMDIKEKNEKMEKVPVKIYSFKAFRDLRERINNIQNDIKNLKPMVLTLSEALDLARTEMLSKEERILWQEVKNRKQRINDLRKFLDYYSLPSNSSAENRHDYNKAIIEINKEISESQKIIQENIRLLSPKFRELAKPQKADIIHNNAIQFLRENYLIKKKFLAASEELSSLLDDFNFKSKEIENGTSLTNSTKITEVPKPKKEQTVNKDNAVSEKPSKKEIPVHQEPITNIEKHFGLEYTVKDVLRFLNENIKILNSELLALYKEHNELRKKVLSEDRAIYIAENIFTNGQIKVSVKV